MTMFSISPAERQARFLKCIGEPTRLEIIKLLAQGEKCVGEMVRGLQKEQSSVSHHLKALRACNVVIARHDARKVYYRLADPRIAEIVFSSQAILKDVALCEEEGCCDE